VLFGYFTSTSTPLSSESYQRIKWQLTDRSSIPASHYLYFPGIVSYPCQDIVIMIFKLAPSRRAQVVPVRCVRVRLGVNHRDCQLGGCRLQVQVTVFISGSPVPKFVRPGSEPEPRSGTNRSTQTRSFPGPGLRVDPGPVTGLPLQAGRRASHRRRRPRLSSSRAPAPGPDVVMIVIVPGQPESRCQPR
jgi:hypothetical protein